MKAVSLKGKVKKTGDKKPFKGKKKYSNLEEKKQKGVHLNQIERRKIVKIEEKKKLKSVISEKVNAELAAIQERERSASECSEYSESSFGSQPVKQTPEKKKRVSFGRDLEKVKVFDKTKKDLEIKPSDASPGRSILSKKKTGVTKTIKKDKNVAKKVKKLEIKDGNDDEMMDTTTATTPVSAVQPLDPEEKENKDREKLFPLAATKRTKITVSKKVKEQLLAMPKKERKAFLREMKARKSPHADRAMECKLLWETIRSSKTPAKEKEEAITRLIGLVKGYAKVLIYAHDTSRVIECLVALNRPGVNALLFNELTPEIVKMCKSKYARFFVTKMLKFGSKDQRNLIVDSLRGHAVSLMRMVWAAEVLEIVYNEYTNAQQRFDIVSEFYGKEFVLFRTDKVRTLDEIVTEEPAKKKAIVKHLEEVIMDVIDKTTVKLSLTHRLIYEFMCHCDKEQRENIIDSLKDKLPELVHSQLGSRAVMKCIWNSAPKERKLMVKNFKDLAVKCAMEKHGHRVLMAIFDSVDDTVLVNKFITQELANNIGSLIPDQFGCRVIYYLVNPRDSRRMLKDVIAVLEEGDGNEHTKKAAKDRFSELFECIKKPLYTYLAANVEELMTGSPMQSKFLLDSLEPSRDRDMFTRVIDAEDRMACNEAIAQACAEEFIPCNSEKLHPIEHQGGSFVMIGLLRFDEKLGDEEKLSTKLAELDKVHLSSWIGCNRGCIILGRMYEHGSEKTKAIVKTVVKVNQLKKYTSIGALRLLAALTGQPIPADVEEKVQQKKQNKNKK